MNKPKPEVPSKVPVNIELEEGDYYWCACGRSKNQPFCDGSHQGTEFEPIKYTVKGKKKLVSFCNCKHTKFPPYCDGIHVTLD